jgi:hypothetical protein
MSTHTLANSLQPATNLKNKKDGEREKEKCLWLSGVDEEWEMHLPFNL